MEFESYLLGLFTPIIGMIMMVIFAFAYKLFKKGVELPKIENPIKRKEGNSSKPQRVPCPECGSKGRKHKKMCSRSKKHEEMTNP